MTQPKPTDPNAAKSALTRRQFLETAAGVTVAGSLLPRVWAAEIKNGIPYRTLGNTGENVSCIGLGGYHLGSQSDEQESIRIIRTALDEGINFLDNCWDYNGGASEVRMGKALRDGYRKKAFLMTKIDARTRQGAARQIDESLRRLQTDTIDLLQFHEVIRDTDPELIFAAKGGMEAVLEAKQKGKVRYIGFTGHKSPEFHLKMLNAAFARNFTLNTVQMPLNLMDAHYDSFEKKVLPVLVKHNIGVLGMKPMGDGLILKSKDGRAGRMSPVRPHAADQRGHHRLRFSPHPATGAESGTNLQAPERRADRRSSGPHCARGPERRMGALQDVAQLRRDLSESAVAGLARMSSRIFYLVNIFSEEN